MTVRINKDAINLREKLSQLDKPSGLVGEELLRADTSADAREALNLEEHLFEDFESTGIDDNATSTKVTVSDSGLDVDGNLSLGDNDKATFGASDALQIYHSGTNSFISEIGTGDLRIRSNKIRMEAPDSQNMIIVTEDAGVQAFYNGTERLSVTPTGVYVTDTITAVNTSAGSTKPLKLYNNTLGANNQVGIDFHTAGTLYGTIEAGYGASSPEMNLKVGNAPSKAMTLKGGGDVHFYEDTGTTAKFVWDASAESLGIGNSVSGDINASSGVADVAVGSGSGTSGLTVYSGSDSYGALCFSDGTSGTAAYQGYIKFDHTNNALSYTQDNTERMRIDSTGNVGIGTASPTEKLDFGGTGWLKVGRGTSRSGGVIFPYTTVNSASRNWGIRNDVAAYGDFAILQSTTQGGDLTVGGNEEVRFTINPAGNVGIGTASPSAKLDISSSVGNTKLTGHQILMTRNGNNEIYTQGTSSALALGTNNIERARIDSSGNLLVGQTTPTNISAGMYVRPSSSSGFIADGTTALTMGRLNSDGAIATFLKDGSTVGSIGIESGGFYIDGEAGHTGLRFGAAQIVPRDNNVDTDGATDLGFNGGSFRDLYLSGGVYLGGTGAANKLDDYEEGHWTPSLNVSSNRVGTWTTFTGRYTKIGNIVTVYLTVNGTDMGFSSTSGYVQVLNLPFTVDGNTAGQGSWGGISVGNPVSGTAYAVKGYNHAWIYAPINTNTGSEINMTITYRAA